MAKKNDKKPSVNVKDLRSKKSPKGGATFKEFTIQKTYDKASTSLSTPTSSTGIKLNTADSLKVK